MSVSHSTQVQTSQTLHEYVRQLLLEICQIDTTPRADIASLARAEQQVYDILEREAASYGLKGLRSERRSISPQIASHPFFSKLYYTASADHPAGLDVATAYNGRGNLLFMIDGEGSRGIKQAVNAHIDVVRPYIAPRVEGNTLFGRGACDDKASVVTIMAALKLIGEKLRELGRPLCNDLTCMIVTDEETGGNGSLSMAIDRDLKKRYESLMVLECCGSRIYPGNRGALWYKIDARSPNDEFSLFEASAFIIEEMEKEGRAIKAESRHELFPHRPVQTCHGVIGPFGEHPSRINGRVDFCVQFESAPPDPAAVRRLISDILEFALAEYVGLYGDKTKVLDSAGRPKVDHHYDLLDAPDGRGWIIQVHGATGHMGSILENDGAITKMATFVRSLLRSRQSIAGIAGSTMQLVLVNHGDPASLVMEGGQGFLPTHDMPQVMQRITSAVWRGVNSYMQHCKSVPADWNAQSCFKVSFDKLHNAAFAGRADSPDMLNAVASAKTTGIWRDEPIRGWDVSCDSRIFASEYPQLPVLTAGPGALFHAHADNEQVEIDEVVRFAQFLADFVLRQTGTIQ